MSEHNKLLSNIGHSKSQQWNLPKTFFRPSSIVPVPGGPQVKHTVSPLAGRGDPSTSLPIKEEQLPSPTLMFGGDKSKE